MAVRRLWIGALLGLAWACEGDRTNVEDTGLLVTTPTPPTGPDGTGWVIDDTGDSGDSGSATFGDSGDSGDSGAHVDSGEPTDPGGTRPDPTDTGTSPVAGPGDTGVSPVEGTAADTAEAVGG